MGDPDDVVEVVAPCHRHAGVAHGRHRCPRLGQRGVGAQRGHRAARDEHLAQHPLVDLQGAADDLALLRVEVAMARDQVAQLLGRDLLDLRLGPPAQQAHDGVGAAEQCHRGRDRVERTSSGRATASAQGSARCMARRLGASSPNTSVRNVSTSVTPATARARPPSRAPTAWGRAARPGTPPRSPRRGSREGDADLDRGEEAVGVAGQLHQPQRPGTALPFELAELPLLSARPRPSRCRRTVR